jgi:cupin 2 domain-containing protein
MIDNIFDAIPASLDEEAVELIAASHAVRIERIVSQGQASPASGWYDQDQHEWVLLVSGAAVLGFDDGSSLALGRGDCINIPAHRRHRVEWTDPDMKTVWLAVHYD